MQEFQNYNSFANFKGMIVPRESIVYDKKIELAQISIRNYTKAADPTESAFRKMISKIQTVDKHLKKISSNKFFQTTFLAPNELKRKKKSDYPDKKIKL